MGMIISNNDGKQQLYENFKLKKQEMLKKSGVLLSTVYYLLDHKSIAYKLECDVDYLLTFLNKREDSSKADSIYLLEKMCVNQDVQNFLLKESNFAYLVSMAKESPSEDIRASCFRIFATIAFINQSKQVIKQLFFQQGLMKVVIDRLKKEESEDVLCQILSLIIKLSSEELYLELITEDFEIISAVIGFMNHKRNQKLKRLAYAITVNLLCEAELRKSLMRQTQVDVIAKLIAILSQSVADSSTQNQRTRVTITKKETVTALKALSNALQDNIFFLSFLQQKGHLTLAEVFEDEDLEVKEICLCLYVRLAQDRESNILIVLEADLIYDILSLNISSKAETDLSLSIGVVRNMLILVAVMLTTQNHKAIEQMKAFDVIGLLLNIMTQNRQLSYLAFNCLGLLSKLDYFRDKLKQKAKSHSIIDLIIKTIQIHSDKSSEQYKFTLRGLQVFLMSFTEWDEELLPTDEIITLISTLNEEYEHITEATTQFYFISILKRMGEMGNPQISEIIFSLEQYAQQLSDAPGVDSYQQTGFVTEILEKDIMRHMIFYIREADYDVGMHQKILFHSDISQKLQDNQAQEKHQAEINALKLKEQSMVSYINEIEQQKVRLEEEIQTLIGVNYHNRRDKEVQTDLNSEQLQNADGSVNPQVMMKKQKEEILQLKRNSKEQRQKIDYLSDRIIELEQDLVIRDKALQKLTQGTQLADVVGSVKARIKEDTQFKFERLKEHIAYLEGVVETNSKLIKDLTEAIQEKNLHNSALMNEDKLKQGKIDQLLAKINTLEKQNQEGQYKETQLRVVIEKMISEKEQHFSQKEVQLTLPQLQLSTEQVIISELQEQLVHFKVENLKLEEQNRKLENKLKKSEVKQDELQLDKDKLLSQIDLPDSQYVIKHIQINPKSLELTIQSINQALAFIDKNLTRHNFKEELVNYYEDRLQLQHNKYEELLIKHFQQSTHFQNCQLQLNSLQLLVHGSQSPQNRNLSDLIAQQWQQSDKQISRYESYYRELQGENKVLRVKLNEIESQLIQYKKIVLMDQSQYERLFKLKPSKTEQAGVSKQEGEIGHYPLNQTELGVIGLFLQNQNTSDFQRLARILDIVIKSNIDMEFKLKQSTSERLRNEHHLIIEQREAQIRKELLERTENKVRKLENMVEQISLDTQLIESMNKLGNNSQIFLNEALDQVSQMSDVISSLRLEIQNGNHQNIKIPQRTTKPIAEANKTQDQIQQAKIQEPRQGPLNKTQDNMSAQRKKVQTTNLIQIDGKKPRLANDYNKQVKIKKAPQKSYVEELMERLESIHRDCLLKFNSAQQELQEEQKVRARQAADSLKEINIFKDALANRQLENQELLNDVKRIMLKKNELNHVLTKKDLVILAHGPSLSQASQVQSLNQKTSPKNQKSTKLPPNPQVTKLEGLAKINNFLRKKEVIAREESDLHKHQLDKMDKERLALTVENKKLSEQIKYLSKLLKNQREQFRRYGFTRQPSLIVSDQLQNGTTEQSDKILQAQGDKFTSVEVPDDEVVKFLVQIDELNQKNSELEYMLQMALQSSIEKEKLMRGTEDVVESINQKVEQICSMIEDQIPVAKQPLKKQERLPRLPAFTGPDSVFERLSILNAYASKWYDLVKLQVTDLIKQKELLEASKPSNQTLTQAEHQAKLEKYLNIYSARIQTLSSIIASYQRHYKQLEDQVRELQDIPNIQAMNQLPSQRQIESARIEALKRMINLKDILIKHQQTEIEAIKKTIIGDKFSENAMYYVSKEEKEAILRMREFDLQMKVIQDYERQLLLTKEEKLVAGEEHLYLKQINSKIQDELLNIREVFDAKMISAARQSQVANGKIQRSEISQKKQSLQIDDRADLQLKRLELENQKKEYMQKWLNMVQDLIQNSFDSEKCKFYIEILNQELPIVIDIILGNSSLQEEIKNDDMMSKQPSMEISYLETKVKELQSEIETLNTNIKESKDSQIYLRQKNQQLQEENILLKKYLHTKKALADDFKHFYKQDLISENAFLRSKVLSLTPYQETLSLEVATLRQQVNDLNYKILKQDQRQIRELELQQVLEQTLAETQKQLIEKESESYRMLKAQRESQSNGFKGEQSVIDLLVTTADSMNEEVQRLREQNWQLSQNLKAKRARLDAKTAKIQQGKGVIKQYEDKITELQVENEKLKVLKRISHSDVGEDGLNILSNLLGVATIEKPEKTKGSTGNQGGKDMRQLYIDKLVYELGKDGANSVIKFLDEISHYKSHINELSHSVSELKTKNTTLTLLVQDKSLKLSLVQNDLKILKKKELDWLEKMERLEFLYQKLNDDFISQQQALDVYMQIAVPIVGRDQAKAFSKCIDNAKQLSIMLKDVQRQRNYYYESSIQHERQSVMNKS